MNKTKQFWTLFKFIFFRNPLVWFMPLGFSGSIWIPYLTGYAGERPLSSAIENYQLFLVGYLVVIMLAPEIFYSASSQNVWTSTGKEFLLTRATDRKLVYRSQSAFVFLLVLFVPVALLFFSLKDPTLTAQEYSKTLREECVARLPGTTLTRDKYGSTDLLTIINGNVLIGSWNVWTALVTTVVFQLFVMAVYPFKYRRYFLYGVYGLVVLGPLFLIGHSGALRGLLSPSESTFLLFAPHQIVSWMVTIPVVILIQFWCERRFAQLEQ